MNLVDKADAGDKGYYGYYDSDQYFWSEDLEDAADKADTEMVYAACDE
ncbi:MAG TPA: hypothetical protein QF353_07005 [Gammaproteobacteria bacterium]|nr:hypothetical protein [Gammaproteobacteria bacterium]